MKASIVLEGFDGAGKSTLAKFLANAFGLPIVSAGPPAKNDAHAIDCCYDQLCAAETGAILDRITPISRICYQQDVSFEHQSVLHKFLTEIYGLSVIIWCRPSVYTHERSEYDTDEHILDIENRESHIKANYIKIMKSIPHIEYDWRYDNRILLMDEIKRRMINEYIS